MTPEAQGAVERAAVEVAADALVDDAWVGHDEMLTFADVGRIAAAVIKALAAANMLATPPTASHDETAVKFDPNECGNCGRCGHCDPPDETALRAGVEALRREAEDARDGNHTRPDWTSVYNRLDRLLAARAAAGAGASELGGES